MKRRRKVLIILSANLFILLVLPFAGYKWFTAGSLPDTRGKIELHGLRDAVEVIRDEYGIPHIYAENRPDLFFAQGYVHAQDRFWQMEFWRRIGSGRLSELFGAKQLDSDIFLRTMGFARVAEEEYKLLEPEYRAYLDAYAEGVNAYIQDRKTEKLALEFSLLGLTGVDVDIEPWTPVNSITWSKVMAYDLGGNMDDESLILDIIESVGIETAARFFPPESEDKPYIVDSNEYAAFRQKMGLSPIETEHAGKNSGNDSSFGTLAVNGSNSWVISGDLTASGKPILANDMHLSIQMPSIWYETALHCGGDNPLNVKGFSFAGVPGVISGHNGNICWSFANLAVDVQDLYVEKLSRENPDDYLKNGEWLPLKIRYEEIKIEGEEENYIHRVRESSHGPIISDCAAYSGLRGFSLEGEESFPQNYSPTAMSIRWAALEPGRIFKAIFLLNESRDYRDFREALRYWDAPGQSTVYADDKGNIAFQMTGRTPVRPSGTGNGPLPGWTDDYEWRGYIPYDELPASLNPSKGYIVTCNNRVIDESYHYYLSNYYAYGDRAERVSELIEKDRDGLTVSDCREFQGDNYNIMAWKTIDNLMEIDLESEYQMYLTTTDHEERDRKREKKISRDRKSLQSAFSILKEWDGNFNSDSAGAAVYARFWLSLYELLIEDQFPPASYPYKSVPHNENMIYAMLHDPQSPWWDNIKTPEKKETPTDYMGRAFIKGVLAGIEAEGYKIEKWSWGAVHEAAFVNQTLGKSGIALIENIFNRGPVRVSGGASQVNRSEWLMTDPFKVYHISSMRQIIDLSDLGSSIMIHTTGQSGHPGSRHYDDFIPLWRDMEYHPNLWEKQDVLENKRDILKMLPLE